MLAAAGCRTRPRPDTVHLDLRQAALAADHELPWDVVFFGTPAAEAHEDEGFTRDPVGGTPSALVGRRAPISLWWDSPAPRAMIVDLQPEGQAATEALVRLNGAAIGMLRLAGSRERHRVELPAALQKPRRNRIRLEFSTRTGEDPPLVRLHTLLVGPSDDPRLEALAGTDAPAPLASTSVRGVPGLALVSGGSLRYALRLPKRAELRLRPPTVLGGRGGPGAPLTLRVTLEAEGQPERELAHWTVDGAPPADQPEQRVPLPGTAGAYARLGLHVEEDDRATPRWGVWVEPRVVGEPPALDVAPSRSPASSPRPDELSALRRATAGSSALLVILDAARASHLGCYGYGRRTTPEIDRIAAESVVFERAYTTAPLTRTAMASLWTSRYPDQSLDAVKTRQAPRLPPERLRVAQLLSAQGVRTVAFVANTNADPAVGLDAGFAEYQRLYRASGLARAEVFAPAVSTWLQAHGAERFFAYLHFKEPHFPYNPPAPFETLFVAPGTPPLGSQRQWELARTASDEVAKPLPSPGELARLTALYDGNLAYADHAVGRLRETLEKSGLWDRVTLVITADHGEALLEHGYVGHSYQVYEDSIHVPLIVKLPRSAGQAGRRITTLVDHVDLAPTLADLFGLGDSPEARRHFQGQSLLGVVAGASPRAATVVRSAGHQPRRALLDGRLKVIVLPGRRSTEVYDLSRDPAERDDLAGQRPLRTAFYRQSLARWLLAVAERPADAGVASLGAEEAANLKVMGYIE